MGIHMRNENAEKNEEKDQSSGHPYDFQVSGPRQLCTPNWREMIRSSWNDDNYKRTVMACLIQAAYLLELDRQEKREGDEAFAPKWWKPFQYKVVDILVDERDKSIFGATLEWDMHDAFSDFLFMRPSNAPQTIIALRGTLLSPPTVKIDISDDLRIFTNEDLSGSHRFNKTLEAVRRSVEKYGSSEVCMAGHSLGAGLAFDVGKSLAMEGIFVEAHIFNPPSISLPLALRCVVDKFGMVWNMVKGMRTAILPFKHFKKELVDPDSLFDEEESDDDEDETESDDEEEGASVNSCLEIQKWVPHIYVNCSDYICCYYSDSSKTVENCDEDDEKFTQDMVEKCRINRVPPKPYVISKGPTNFWKLMGLHNGGLKSQRSRWRSMEVHCYSTIFVP